MSPKEAASIVIDAWAELDGVTCEVDDLSVHHHHHHHQGEILEPEPAELREEDYPDQLELDTRAPTND